MFIQTNKTSIYKKEELSSDSDEYNFVKNFFDSTVNSCNENRYQTKTPTDFKVFKVIKNNQMTELTALDEKRNNLMLFHGTIEKGVDSILKEDFKNS